jgi:hypothetical protein
MTTDTRSHRFCYLQSQHLFQPDNRLHYRHRSVFHLQVSRAKCIRLRHIPFRYTSFRFGRSYLPFERSLRSQTSWSLFYPFHKMGWYRDYDCKFTIGYYDNHKLETITTAI